MTVRKKRCKECKEWFDTERGTQTPTGFFCSFDHMMSFIERKQNAQRERAIKKANAGTMRKEKERRTSDRKRKEALKTAGDYIKEAQAAVNRYVRARDYGKPCICCGALMDWHKPGGAVDSGHYRSRGAAGHLRFNVFNIHAQSVKCNRFLSGNAVDYRINLIKKIGLDRVERLEQDNTPRKFTIDYLKRVKRIFAKRARWYEKRINR